MKYRRNYSKPAAIEDIIQDIHTPIYLQPSSPKASNRSMSMEAIIRYIHSHKNTQLATLSTSDAGIGALKYIQKRLDLAGGELLRMEDESGLALNVGQLAKVNTYSRESSDIEQVLNPARNKFRVSSGVRSHDNHCMT